MTDATTVGTFIPEVQFTDDGEQVQVVLTLELPEGTHIEPATPSDPFLIPTVVTVNGLDDVTVTYPESVKKDLGWNDLELDVLVGHLEFVVTGRPRQGASINGGLTYQPCVGGACLPPRTTVWSVPSESLTAA